MARRLPRPPSPQRPRCEIDEAELLLIENVAHLCRLSTASMIRVLLIDAASQPERVAEWKAIAERLIASGPPPDRPKKKPGPKTGTKKRRGEAEGQ